MRFFGEFFTQHPVTTPCYLEFFGMRPDGERDRSANDLGAAFLNGAHLLRCQHTRADDFGPHTPASLMKYRIDAWGKTVLNGLYACPDSGLGTGLLLFAFDAYRRTVGLHFMKV